MKHNRKGKGPLIALACVAMLFLITAIVMWLWNAILPEVVGAKTINYWQAMGILVLSKILFGGLKGGVSGKNCGGWKKHHLESNMETMSPEEREVFKEKLKERFKNNRFCR